MKKCLFALVLMSILVAQAEESEGSVLSTNTFGVLKVSSSCTNTIIAVPWADYSKDIDNPPEITATNLVKTSNLKQGDTILAYENGRYNAWELDKNGDEGGKWVAAKMWTTLGPDEAGSLTTDEALVKRGKAFWLVRKGADTRVDKAIYLYGQAATNDVEVEVASGSVTAPTSMLIANPFAFDLNLNGGLVATSGSIQYDTKKYTEGDAITFPNGNTGKLTVCYYDGSEWYYNKTTQSGRSITTTKKTDAVLPAGTGFWYGRRGSGELKLKLKASGKKVANSAN